MCSPHALLRLRALLGVAFALQNLWIGYPYSFSTMLKAVSVYGDLAAIPRMRS
jgi:hypothetical protein